MRGIPCVDQMWFHDDGIVILQVYKEGLDNSSKI